jgi:NAD(P)-dependent dehydrogenase (short-subunit alcohol dehydrogenase family)
MASTSATKAKPWRDAGSIRARCARLARAAEHLGKPADGGARLLVVGAGAGSLADLDRLVAGIRERHGRLDGVFANAGLGVFQRVPEVTEQDFDHTVDDTAQGRSSPSREPYRCSTRRAAVRP